MMATETRILAFDPDRLVVTLEEWPKGCITFSVSSLFVEGRVGDKIVLVKDLGILTLVEVSEAGVVNSVNGLEFTKDQLPYTFKWVTVDADPGVHTSKKMKEAKWLGYLTLRLQMRTAEVAVKGMHLLCFPFSF
jgi:hypothetical protein